MCKDYDSPKRRQQNTPYVAMISLGKLLHKTLKCTLNAAELFVTTSNVNSKIKQTENSRHNTTDDKKSANSLMKSIITAPPKDYVSCVGPSYMSLNTTVQNRHQASRRHQNTINLPKVIQVMSLEKLYTGSLPIVTDAATGKGVLFKRSKGRHDVQTCSGIEVISFSFK